MNSPKPLLSLIITVYRGSKLLDDTFAHLSKLVKELTEARMELIFVDDGSDDDSYEKILAYGKEALVERVCAVRLSRNYGAMSAYHAGLTHARGDCVAVLPQDLQDPPEAVVAMFNGWHKEGIKANFTTRTKDRYESRSKVFLALTYHYLFAKLVMPHYPPRGLGVLLIDRQIVDELCRKMPRHTDIVLYTFSLGFSSKLYPYPRPPAKQKSGWVLAKQIKLVLDNFIAFSYLPVRLMTAIGFVTALLGFAYAAYVVIIKSTGWLPMHHPPGWVTLIVLITCFSGLIMMMLGIIGEYLWRILDNVRNSPTFLVDKVVDQHPPPTASKEDVEKETR